MGLSKSGAECAQKFTRLAREYRDLPYVEVREATAVAKRIIAAVLPSRLRGVGKRGKAIRVRDSVTRVGGGAVGRISTLGPTHLIERDTTAHVMPRERGPRARRRVVVIPGVGVRARAQSPGTKGKHLFAKGAATAAPAIERIHQTRVELPLRRIF